MSQELPASSQPSADVAVDATSAPAGAEELSLEQIEELKARAAQGADAQERFVRLYADFENFKKRAARERDEVRRAATESMISRLLPVLDTFDMAMVAAGQSGANVETLKAGVQMIQSQLRGVFVEQGLEEIDAEGKDFDPALHEAVSQLESLDIPEGRIVQQLRKGYRFKDRLLRPASVVVARAPSDSGSASPDAGDALA